MPIVKVAFIKNNIISNVCVYNEFSVAQMMFENGLIKGQADEIVVLQDGFSVGDLYVDGEFIKKELNDRADDINDKEQS